MTYRFFYLDDLNPRFTLYVLGTEYQQRSSPGKRSELQRTVSRAPKKIALQPLKAGASVCPGGVLEDEGEDDSISDDELEGVPLAGNWCE